MNDLISRQAAIDKLAMWGKIPELNGGQRDVIAITIDMLSSLPSVQPKQKKGTWLLFDDCYCSRCGYKLQMTGLPMHCPNCGAYMKD